MANYFYTDVWTYSAKSSAGSAMVVPRYYHGTSVATEVKSDYFRRRGSAAAVSRKIGHFRHHGSTMAVKNFYNLWMIRAFAAKKI